jgi:dUTP pyrophosphatase
MDLCSIINCSLNPGEVKLIPTGLFVEIPENYEIQIRPRSGLALKNQITVLNTPGTVDSSYRGQIGAILVNFGKETFNIHIGDRIAQCVLCPVEKIKWEKVEQLSETDRGTGGFGSTGIK